MSQFTNTPVTFWIGQQRTNKSEVNPLPYFTGAASGAACQASLPPDATEFSKNVSYYQPAPAGQVSTQRTFFVVKK
jgi:hypothetical protein